MLFFYLGDGLFGSAFQFELHHVDVLLGLKDKVNAALGGMVLHLRIEAHQLEHNEQHVLIMKLQLAGKFVRRISEELEYAKAIMRRVHCKIINVSNRAIEETAGIILDYVQKNRDRNI